MSYYKEAANELKHNPREDLWFQCMSRTDMDKKKASALYIQKSAELLSNEAEALAQRQKRYKEILKEESELERLEIQLNSAYANTAKESLKSTNPYVWATISSILSIVFFARPLVSDAEGFFSIIWRWPIATLHVAAAAVATFSLFSFVRRFFITNETLRYNDRNWQKLRTYGFFALAYLLFFIIF